MRRSSRWNSEIMGFTSEISWKTLEINLYTDTELSRSFDDSQRTPIASPLGATHNLFLLNCLSRFYLVALSTSSSRMVAVDIFRVSNELIPFSSFINISFNCCVLSDSSMQILQIRSDPSKARSHIFLTFYTCPSFSSNYIFMNERPFNLINLSFMVPPIVFLAAYIPAQRLTSVTPIIIELKNMDLFCLLD